MLWDVWAAYTVPHPYNGEEAEWFMGLGVCVCMYVCTWVCPWMSVYVLISECVSWDDGDFRGIIDDEPKSWLSISDKLKILAPIFLWQIGFALKCSIPGEMHLISLSLDSDHRRSCIQLQGRPQPKCPHLTPVATLDMAGWAWRWGLRGVGCPWE